MLAVAREHDTSFRDLEPGAVEGQSRATGADTLHPRWESSLPLDLGGTRPLTWARRPGRLVRCMKPAYALMAARRTPAARRTSTLVHEGLRLAVPSKLGRAALICYPETLTRAVPQEVSMAYTLSEVTESIGTITLDHERRRNALSRPLVEEVVAALRSFHEARVRVVILRAKPGVKVFSAG